MSSPGLLALTALVDHLSGHVGAARARQLRWVAGELARHDAARPTPDLAALLSEGHLVGFLAEADAGLLRARATGRPLPSPIGTQRARRACLRVLAAAARVPVPDLPAAGGAARPLAAPDEDARRALALLVAAARAPRARPSAVRAALVASLVHHHDLRVGEIAPLALADTDAGTGTLTYVPDPQGSPATFGPVAVELHLVARDLVRQWLPVRAGLVRLAGNQGPGGDSRTRTLLVSVHGNHDGAGARRPPGLPVMARGLVRAHARAMDEVNSTLVARGAAPVPTTLGALRLRPDPLRRVERS